MTASRSQHEVSVKLLAPPAPDQALVDAAKLGDRRAFAELWKRHSAKPFNVVYRITKNHEDAEDVLQEAWMKAYVHLKTFDGRSTFSTWFARIAINTALMKLRRTRAHPERCMEYADGETSHQLEIADQTDDAEQRYINHETVELVRRAICRLSPSLRTVVALHHSNDGSMKELAALAGISISATKSRLNRARTVLRKALVGEGAERCAAFFK